MVIVTNSAATIGIGLLSYPGVQLATLHGLTDLFTTADRLNKDVEGTNTSLMQVSHWRADQGRPTPSFVSDGNGPARQTVLILLPSLEGDSVQNLPAEVSEWIVDQHRAGTVICSVCKAAFILARSGLLQGRVVTTHWALAESFSSDFPDVTVQPEQLLVDDGDIITAGGVMAWIDLGLHIIDRFAGSTAMLQVARFFLVDPPRREQRYYQIFSPRFDHGDDAVLRAQRRIQRHYNHPLTLRSLASSAAVSERTLVRRFQSIFDMTPTAYLQRLRIEKARSLLDLSRDSLNQIAWKVGYEDPGSFRNAFRKIVGLAPAAYRRRFGTAAARSPR